MLEKSPNSKNLYIDFGYFKRPQILGLEFITQMEIYGEYRSSVDKFLYASTLILNVIFKVCPTLMSASQYVNECVCIGVSAKMLFIQTRYQHTLS